MVNHFVAILPSILGALIEAKLHFRNWQIESREDECQLIECRLSQLGEITYEQISHCLKYAEPTCFYSFQVRTDTVASYTDVNSNICFDGEHLVSGVHLEDLTLPYAEMKWSTTEPTIGKMELAFFGLDYNTTCDLYLINQASQIIVRISYCQQDVQMVRGCGWSETFESLKPHIPFYTFTGGNKRVVFSPAALMQAVQGPGLFLKWEKPECAVPLSGVKIKYYARAEVSGRRGVSPGDGDGGGGGGQSSGVSTSIYSATALILMASLLMIPDIF